MTTKKLWAVFANDDEDMLNEHCYGHFLTLKEARQAAAEMFAERLDEDWHDPRTKIVQLTFEVSREYIAEAMSSYEGQISPIDYKLKEVAGTLETLDEEEERND